jgi:hypothetical protein
MLETASNKRGRRLSAFSVKPYFLEGDFALYHADSIFLMNELSDNSVDMIFADPPYNLSNGGFTVHAGRMVSVNKGDWDVSKGFADDYEFHYRWLEAARRILKPNGTLWVSGVGGRLANNAAGEIGDHDALLRHRVLEMQRALGLADDVQDRGGEEEGVDFGQDRIDRLFTVIVAPAVKTLLEKGAGQGIGDAREDAGAKIDISEKPRQKRKCRTKDKLGLTWQAHHAAARVHPKPTRAGFMIQRAR